MARRSPLSRVSRIPRRKTAWGIGPAVSGTSQALSATGSFLFTGSAPTEEGMTLVRTRGEIDLWLTSADAADSGFFGAIGIGVVKEPAFTVGITAVPVPFADADFEGWIWHQFFNVRHSGGTLGEQAMDNLRIPIDSKAMRKVNTDDVIYCAIEVTEIGTSVVSVALESRCLFKLA